MNFPIDETDGCAFAIRTGYEQKVYPKNIGRGGGHYPATSVCAVYQLDRLWDREDNHVPLPQGVLEQLTRIRQFADDGDCGYSSLRKVIT